MYSMRNIYYALPISICNAHLPLTRGASVDARRKPINVPFIAPFRARVRGEKSLLLVAGEYVNRMHPRSALLAAPGVITQPLEDYGRSATKIFFCGSQRP